MDYYYTEKKIVDTYSGIEVGRLLDMYLNTGWVICCNCGRVSNSDYFNRILAARTDECDENNVPLPGCVHCGHIVVAPVDQDIIFALDLLNKKGYRSKLSCGGHVLATDTGVDVEPGYIAFEYFDIRSLPNLPSHPFTFNIDAEQEFNTVVISWLNVSDDTKHTEFESMSDISDTWLKINRDRLAHISELNRWVMSLPENKTSESE